MSIPDFLQLRTDIAKRAYKDLIHWGYSESSAKLLVYYYVLLNQMVNDKTTKEFKSTSYYSKYHTVSMRMVDKIQKLEMIKKAWGDSPIPKQWIEKYKASGKWYE